ncbi:integumentary mucin A.1-like [Branchiostoma lanceolatum]|uniref:integumentary mucin A.1-like n=1 Tax=Branchiostoma lanceolatum TaxID=7740 RepID=UPI0034565AA5
MTQFMKYIVVLLTVVVRFTGAGKDSTTSPSMYEPEGTTNGVVTVVPTTEASPDTVAVDSTAHLTFAEKSAAHTTLPPNVVSTESEPEGTTNGVETVVPTTEATTGVDREPEGTTNGVATVLPTVEGTTSPDTVVVDTTYVYTVRSTFAETNVYTVQSTFAETEAHTTPSQDVGSTVSESESTTNDITTAEASPDTTVVDTTMQSTYFATSRLTTPPPETVETTQFSPTTDSDEMPSTSTTPPTTTTEEPCNFWVLCQPVESLTTQATTTTNNTNSTRAPPTATTTSTKAGNGWKHQPDRLNLVSGGNGSVLWGIRVLQQQRQCGIHRHTLQLRNLGWLPIIQVPVPVLLRRQDDNLAISGLGSVDQITESRGQTLQPVAL